jgi:hypothetical protein
MLKVESKEDDRLYVFDELRLPAEDIPGHPSVQCRGKVIETLEVSLESSNKSAELTAVLDGCDDVILCDVVGEGRYGLAINHIRGLLSRVELDGNKNLVYIHKVDTSK